MDSDSASSVDYNSGEEGDVDDDDDTCPSSPLSQVSHSSMASSYTNREKNRTNWIFSIILWLLLPARLFYGIPFYLYIMFLDRGLKGPTSTPGRFHSSHVHAVRKSMDHIVEQATDRRRGVIEVCLYNNLYV